MKRLCLFAGYSPQSAVDDYVIYYVEHLSRHADIYYFADNAMPNHELAKIDPFIKGRWAAKHGKYDFGSWQMLFSTLGWSEIEKYDALILANDSNYGPIQDLSQVFAKMDHEDFDFWGITQNNGVYIHLQSYFLNFYKRVFSRDDFKCFIESISKEDTKIDVCLKYEIGLSKMLHEKGLLFDAYINRFKENIPFEVDVSAFQNTLIRAGSPFLKRKVFSDTSFAQEDISETWQLLKKYNYPDSLICNVPDHADERLNLSPVR